jgi:hypothetical protein
MTRASVSILAHENIPSKGTPGLLTPHIIDLFGVEVDNEKERNTNDLHVSYSTNAGCS